MNHDPNEQGISKLIQSIKKQFADFKNIGKCRMSVRISNHCYFCFEYAPYDGDILYQRQKCVNLVNSRCSIKRIVIEDCYPQCWEAFL